MASIEPILAFLYEPAMMFALGFPIPRLRMKFEPGLLLLVPLLKKGLRNGVSEAERDKVRRLRLFAMRQIAPPLNNLATRIESVERNSASKVLARRNRLEACVTRGIRNLRVLPGSLA